MEGLRELAEQQDGVIYIEQLEEYMDDLEELQRYRELGTVEDIQEHIQQSQEEFDMLMKYLKIGTVEECREAIEKQDEMQVKPANATTFPYKGICPVCGNRILLSENYCSKCGQKMGVRR